MLLLRRRRRRFALQILADGPMRRLDDAARRHHFGIVLLDQRGDEHEPAKGRRFDRQAFAEAEVRE